MPAPAHLHGILAVLGDGGTVDLAERVHRHILDLPGADADMDALRAQNAALEAKVDALRTLVGQSFYEAVGKLGDALTVTAVTITPDDDIVDVACLVIRDQARVISEGNAEIHARIAAIQAERDANPLLTISVERGPDGLDDDDPEDALDWQALEAAPVELPAPDPTNDEIRTWCLANEVPCSARGPVPRRSRDAYLAAHLPASTTAAVKA